MAYPFYKRGIINKPNIQSLGRWSIIEQTLNRNRDFSIQAKIVRHQQQVQQQQMCQKQLNNNSPRSVGYN
jgi:hypothetical protein